MGSEIWVSNEGIALMDSVWEVGKAAGNRVSKWPERSSMFQNVSECSRILENVPECYIIFQKVRERSRMFHNVQEFNVLECKVLECPRMFWTYEEISGYGMFQPGLSVQKRSRTF